MENGGYEDEQGQQLDVASRENKGVKVEIAETIDETCHVYEDIALGRKNVAELESGPCVIRTENNISLVPGALPKPDEPWLSRPRDDTTIGNSWPISGSKPPPEGDGCITGKIITKHSLPVAKVIDTERNITEEVPCHDFAKGNAEMGLVCAAGAGSSGGGGGGQLGRQPPSGRRPRRKKDCKLCRDRLSEEELSRMRCRDVLTHKCDIQEGDSGKNRAVAAVAAVAADDDLVNGAKRSSIGFLPTFGQLSEKVASASASRRLFTASGIPPLKSSLVSAAHAHEIPGKISSRDNILMTGMNQGKPVANMRVNSIYSRDRSYERDGKHIFFTDPEEPSAFKMTTAAYTFPTRTQQQQQQQKSPVVQNRINLRRSVRGEPTPPQSATLLKKHRHGWTLHFVKPLKKQRSCKRGLICLILVMCALVGIGSIALYVLCGPERLRVIRQYLKSSSGNWSSVNAAVEEINSTRIATPVAASIGGGGNLLSSTAPSTELEMKVKTTESPRDNFTRYCDDCLIGEVCVALISEEVPICRHLTDADDPTGCGGLCIVNKQKCHRLDIDAFRCLDIEHNCLEDEWSCSNALCIPLVKRCDGHMNCYDHSDEHNCTCNLETDFQCGNETSCLPLEKRCDRKIDCWDAADEINCTLACPMENQFTCTNGECILKSRFCDGLADCSDASDEPDGCQGRCNKQEFTCENSRCITKAMKCNGSDDCGDGTDERHCKTRPIQTSSVFV